jgi:predicted alpha/beta superfamily hydrolase
MKKETFKMRSTHVNDDFLISVYLPIGFKETKIYPVIYLTDADLFFHMTMNILQLLINGKEIPEAILVGIGYTKGRDVFEIRNRDLTPSPYNLPDVAGGSKQFIDFIKNELIPAIDSMYQTSVKIYVGDSLGGLLGSELLLTQPNLFDHYVIGSPSLYWDDRLLLKTNHKLSKIKTKKRIFLGVGELEATYEPEFARMVDNTVDLYDLIVSEKNECIESELLIFDKETHFSVIPSTITRGLRYVFKARGI